MCGRFARDASGDEIAAHFALTESPETERRFNIAPTQPVLIVVDAGSSGRRAGEVRWGIIPRASREMADVPPLINARCETVGARPTFRESYRKRRCLIPATGFFEWTTVNGRRWPYLIQPQSGGLWGLAGIWDRWTAPDGEVISSCAILTTDPNPAVAALHDRMPVIITPKEYDRWLRGETPEPTDDVFQPVPADAVVITPVDPRVNRTDVDSPTLLERSDPPDRQELDLFE